VGALAWTLARAAGGAHSASLVRVLSVGVVVFDGLVRTPEDSSYSSDSLFCFLTHVVTDTIRPVKLTRCAALQVGQVQSCATSVLAAGSVVISTACSHFGHLRTMSRRADRVTTRDSIRTVSLHEYPGGCIAGPGGDLARVWTRSRAAEDDAEMSCRVGGQFDAAWRDSPVRERNSPVRPWWRE